MNRHSLRVFATLCSALALAACGSSSSPSGAMHMQMGSSSTAPVTDENATSRPSVTVRIRNYAYDPSNLTVRAGANVTFVNDDQTSHTATSNAGPASFDTGTIHPGARITVTLKTPGSYRYHCEFHAFMLGRITVVK